MNKWSLIVNAGLAGIVLVGYVILTALHDDASNLLAVLGGQGLAAVVGKATDVVRNGAGLEKP